MFNCGEGTFRLLNARGFPFRFLSNVFCTSNHWERVGGVPTLAQALFVRSSQFPTFYGPPQLENFLHEFAELTKKQFNSKSYFEDSHMQVDSVPLKSVNESRSKSTTVFAYVCRLRPHKGTINQQKLDENNIPVELTGLINHNNDGENITLHDGRAILANDFSTPGFAGSNFLSKVFLWLLTWPF